MLANLGGMHLLIILGIVLLLFGSTKLPALAKGLGQSISIFKKETEKGAEADAASAAAPTVAATAAPATTAPAPADPAR
ncbi:twin-arginine translocase TatA/TatE family subunit [Frigoribacterium sp. CFBP 8754]|uniref:twin-arginine translocase TatA/TatE family subunit n=1 Tax=unclassified Frigoribacterium TaxID=2627005 RepID=UPI0017852977|nr:MULTISPECIES: twin-arginine translocase TatA/TatE family subunit [unclassified Frigoribacterium]MBD8660373.1 twin-arginine translocase TatA/TatE family subunit [Frigoribacterium sp. CFBP 8754]MBD8726719.1 twin-arginine translocase TatA/TatE family subunit [Frigoribacterium sp. CFBP 13707]